jgi:hypothetical protein
MCNLFWVAIVLSGFQMRTKVVLSIAAAVVAATPALAVTNVIKNGSFEQAGTTGPGAFTGWVRSNTPDLSPPEDQPASVIVYNSGASYPVSAYGEAVTPDNIVGSASPDAVGNYGAYFVGDFSANETLSQLTYLSAGNYRVGFSYYLTANGLSNVNNSSIDVTILGTNITSTAITGGSTAQTWLYSTAVANISLSGWYPTALVFNSNGFPAKDVVIDRVFGVRTNDPATVFVPQTSILSVPEPATWAMLVIGFGLVGFGMRRRRPTVLAA